MNYSIQFERLFTPFLFISPRKKALKHTLLTVLEGLVLVKLGKKEYAIEKGDYFWIPADCLVSMTYLSRSTISKVDFSTRLTNSFSKKAGYVDAESMIKIIFNQLARIPSDDYQKALLQVIRYEVDNIVPTLKMSQLSQKVNDWRLESCVDQLEKEISQSLKLREARKLILSGQNREQVAQRWFGLSLEQFDQRCEHELGMRITSKND